MSTGVVPGAANGLAIPRRVPRYRVAVPLSVTVRRAGVTDSIPGRSLDVGEGGLGALLAGEVSPGEAVGVEFQVPSLAAPLRARAVVRHHAQLRCGLEFLSLSPEQRALLRNWMRQNDPIAPLTRSAPPPRTEQARANSRTPSVAARAAVSKAPPRNRLRPYPRRMLHFLFAVAVLLLAVSAGLWWNWERGWQELEAQVSASSGVNTQRRVNVPEVVMLRRLAHRVDAVYPDDLSQAGLSSSVAVQVVVGPDGTVTQVRGVNGPEELAQAATNAVRWWRFHPYVVNGEPVTVETTLTVEFRPSL
jgi:TonB family protein